MPNGRAVRQWVDALRSDQYQQGKNALHIIEESSTGAVHKLCCLGVACEIARREIGLHAVERDGRYYYGAGLLTHVIPPQEVIDWLGIYDVSVPVGGEDFSLAQLNDDGMTFDQIADLIEKAYLPK